MKNKSGLSLVISALIMIVLVIVGVSIIWAVVDKMINKEVSKSEACFGIFEKVNINNDYTCYNYSSEELLVSIEIGDIELEKLLVSISGKGTSKSFNLYEGANYDYVRKYPSGAYNESLNLPGKNSGATYVVKTTKVSIIELAPIINGQQCEVSDSLSEIDDCALLA